MLRKRIVASLIMTCFLMMFAVACGSESSDGFVYSRRVSANGIFVRGELYRKSILGKKKVDNVYMDCMTKTGDDTVLGICSKGPGTDRYIATYDLEEKTLTKITQVVNSIEEQRVSANADLSAVYYGSKEYGIVRYDISTGESSIVVDPGKLKEPQITKDEKKLFYLSDWELTMQDMESGRKTVLASNVHTYALSHDEKFIIYTRLGAGYKSIVYRYDIESGEERELMPMDDQIKMLSISSDNTGFGYVTYTDAYFSSWAKTVLNVCDLDTLKSHVAYKSGFADFIPSIILE